MLKVPFENKVFQITDSLEVDKNLQFSQDDLITSIQQKINPKKLSKSEKLKSVKEFPSVGTLALLSWKVYESLEKITLPDRWELLTTAYNKELSNGYFGAAFINPEENRVIVSHRGTEVNNVGAVVADIAGIFLNNYGGQMSAACTFADKIVQALKAVEVIEDVHFEIFFTGHSLGGWLAQITTFSTAFLKQDGKAFTKLNPRDGEPYHPQTTVFESPGCLPMLQKLKSKFDSVDGEHIDLCDLSIMSYLSAPNLINTCNEHFGKVYRIFDDSTKMNFLDRNVAYTLTTHSIERIVNFFHQKKFLHMQEVVEWPTREGFTGTQELEKFLKHADHRNRFHIKSAVYKATEKIRIRYKTRQFERFLYPINIFSKREQQFLEVIYWLKHSYEPSAFLKVFHELNSDMKDEEILENLSSFEIVGRNVCLNNPEKIQFFPTVKLLLKLFPRIREIAQSFLQDQKNRAKVFAFETSKCLKSFEENVLDFKLSTVDLASLFEAEKQFVNIKLKQGSPRNWVLIVYKALQNSNSKCIYEEGSLLVVNLERFCIVTDLINLREFLSTRTTENFLLITYCENSGDQLSEGQKKSLESTFDTLRSFEKLKIVFIGDTEFIIEEAKHKINNRFYEVGISHSWDDLTIESQKKVLNRDVKFQGLSLNLPSLMKSRETSCLNSDILQCLQLNDDVFLQLLNEGELEINRDPLSSCDFSAFTADQVKREIKAKKTLESLESSDDIFVISGIYDDCIEGALKTLSSIFKDSNLDQQKLIDENLVLDDDFTSCKNRRLQIISTVGSKNCLEDFDKKCRLENPESRTFHWIKIEEGKLFWRKTSTISNFIERRFFIDSKASSYDDLLSQNLLAVVGKSGDGKSSFLTRLAMESIKRSWIIVLNLNELTFKNFETSELNIESFSSFLEKTSRYEPENSLQSFLLRHKLSNDSQIPIHFFIDGLDDETLSDKDRMKAISLIKFINGQTKCRVTFASSESVAKDLQAKICNLGSFDRSERESLLKNTWKTRYSLTWGSKKCNEIFMDDEKSKFKAFSKIILDQLDNTLEQGNLMGVPKQLKLLAEGFQEDFAKFVQLNNMKQKILVDGLKLKTFYKHYINTKYDLYVTAKTRVADVDTKSKIFFKTLQNVSVDSLVPQEVKSLLSNNAELLSPDFIIFKLTKGHSPPKVLSIFTGYLLTDSRCKVLREYLDTHNELLPKSAAFDITEEISSSIAGQPMITACKEGHSNILAFLIEIVKKQPNLQNFLLNEDTDKKTALDYAIKGSNEACVEYLTKFLVENGDPSKLRIILHRIGREKFEKYLDNCENYEFAEWFYEYLINNEIE